VEHSHDDLLVTYDSRDSTETAHLIRIIKKMSAQAPLCAASPDDGLSAALDLPSPLTPATPSALGSRFHLGSPSSPAKRAPPASRDLRTPLLRTPESARKSDAHEAAAQFSTLVRDPLVHAHAYSTQQLLEACRAYQTALKAAASGKGFMGALHALRRRANSTTLACRKALVLAGQGLS